MLRKLGQARLDALNVRANTPGKKDDAMTKLYIKELMKDLDDE